MSGKLAYYGRGVDPALAERYWRLLGLPAGSRALDVGCGTGKLGAAAPAGIEVHGVDHDAGAVAKAQAFEKAQVVDLERGTLPYPDGHFAAAIAKDVLEHVERPTHILSEIQRVLAPGGRLLVSVPMEFPWVVWNDYTHVRGFTHRALTTMLADLGFTDLKVWGMGAVPGAGRLGLVDRVPKLLELPLMRPLFGRSWEALATRT